MGVYGAYYYHFGVDDSFILLELKKRALLLA
jgi:hypothetical protein